MGFDDLDFNDPASRLAHLADMNRYVSYSAFLLGAFQLLFVVNFFRSMSSGVKASDNPWEVGTLEWSVSSPPPVHNFDTIPTELEEAAALDGCGRIQTFVWVILPNSGKRNAGTK